MTEEWIVWKDTRYNSNGSLWEISNFGRVKRNHILVDFKTGNYYIKIAGKYLHRLIAEFFIPNPENKKYVDHIDTDIHNNHINNLRWVNAKENSNNPITINHMSNSAIGKTISNETRKQMSISHIGHTLSESGRKKLSKSKIGNKSLTGYCWIHLENNRKCIKKEYVNEWLSNGWILGMGKNKRSLNKN